MGLCVVLLSHVECVQVFIEMNLCRVTNWVMISTRQACKSRGCDSFSCLLILRNIFSNQSFLTDRPPYPIQWSPWPRRTSRTATHRHRTDSKNGSCWLPRAQRRRFKYDGKYLVNTDTSILCLVGAFSCWEQNWYFSLPCQSTPFTPSPEKTPGSSSSSQTMATSFRSSRASTRLEVKAIIWLMLLSSSWFVIRCTGVKRIFCHGLRSRSIMRWDFNKFQHWFPCCSILWFSSSSERNSWFRNEYRVIYKCTCCRYNFTVQCILTFLEKSRPYVLSVSWSGDLCDRHARAVRFYRGWTPQKFLLPETFISSIQVWIRKSYLSNSVNGRFIWRRNNPFWGNTEGWGGC